MVYGLKLILGWEIPRRTRSESRVKLLYDFETESQPVVKMRVKIEINAVENFTLLGLENKSFAWGVMEAIFTSWVKN